MPKRKPTPSAPLDSDGQIIYDILMARIEHMGRGGKTDTAQRTGMKLSAFLKRLKLGPAALDPFTMKCITLVFMSKSDEPLGPTATRYGDYLMEIRDGEPVWIAERKAEP